MGLEVERSRHDAITRLAWLCAGDLNDEQIARLVRLAEEQAKPVTGMRAAIFSLIDRAIDLL